MTLRLSLIIEGDAGEAKAALDDVKRGLEGTRGAGERTTRDVQRGFAGMRGPIDAARGSLAQFRVLLTSIAAGALTLFLKRASDIGGEIDDTAKALGIAIGKLQEYRHAALLAGVSQAELDTALQFFSKSLGDNSSQVTGFHKALGQLGLRMEHLKGLGFDKSLELVSDRLSRVTDTTERNNIAFELFSRTGIKAINFLAVGSAEMAKLAAEARKLGLIISDETIRQAAQAGDEFDRIGGAARVAGVNIAAGFLPALTSIRQLVTDPGFQSGLKNVAGGIADIVKFAVEHKSEMQVVAAMLGGALLLRGFGARGMLAGAAGGGIAAVIAQLTGVKEEAQAAKASVADLEKELATLRFHERRLVAGISAANASPDNVTAWTRELEQTRARIAEVRKELAAPLQVTVRPSGGVKLFPEIDQAVRDLKLQRMTLDGEFKGFADGYAQLLKSLNLTGVDVSAVMSGGVGRLTGQFRELHGELARLQGAQMRLDLETPVERMNRELEKANALLAQGAISQETLNRKVMSLQFPQLTQMTNDLSNFTGQIDQAAVGSINSMTSALADWATGTKSAGDAFRSLGASVTRIIAEMVIRMLVAATIGRLLQSVLGGIFGGFGGAIGGGNIGNPTKLGGFYDKGGYTGDAARQRIADFVHGQEFVVNAAATARHRNLLEAVNDNRLPGYRDGGFVMPPPFGSSGANVTQRSLTSGLGGFGAPVVNNYWYIETPSPRAFEQDRAAAIRGGNRLMGRSSRYA
ncbi:MAG: hypothetical protein GEU91_14200 [Rhizobiales bacterium]|nr:hypothetical protein [Hyphomicrobiales bacterium]